VKAITWSEKQVTLTVSDFGRPEEVAEDEGVEDGDGHGGDIDQILLIFKVRIQEEGKG
jgi:hypothetical protein